MEGQSAIPGLVGFNLLDRPEKYFSQIDGADREHNHQRNGDIADTRSDLPQDRRPSSPESGNW
jgi:hypothetical protein